MTSLRMRVVEAMAEAGAGNAFEILDAMLDCLAENADEWAEETHVPTLTGGDAIVLLAVLREDR